MFNKKTKKFSALLLFFALGIGLAQTNSNNAEKKQNDSLKTKEIEKIVIKGKKKQIEQTEKGIVLNVSGTSLIASLIWLLLTGLMIKPIPQF